MLIVIIVLWTLMAMQISSHIYFTSEDPIYIRIFIWLLVLIFAPIMMTYDTIKSFIYQDDLPFDDKEEK